MDYLEFITVIHIYIYRGTAFSPHTSEAVGNKYFCKIDGFGDGLIKTESHKIVRSLYIYISKSQRELRVTKRVKIVK